MYIEDKEIAANAIIDTGAEVNIIGDFWMPECYEVGGINSKIKGLTGHQIDMIGLSDVKLTLEDGRNVTIRAVITKNNKSVLLGMPFMKSVDAKFNARNNVLFVQGRPYLMYPRVSAIKMVHEAQVEDRDQKLQEVLQRYKCLWEGKPIGRTNVVEHRIKLLTNRPICCRPRKYSEEQLKIIDEEVDKMLRDGVIRLSQSPYASGIVLVKKKTGDWRFCIDYRPLNKITVRDEHPLPKIKDLLKAVKESRYFIALDLKAGYWQIKMDEADIPKTAFRSHRGLYEFIVMPFGLVNAPSTFQRLMELLLGDYRWRGVLTYLDDILIHGKTEEEVFDLFEMVLSRLKSANITINLDKCEFFPTHLKYLGHVIDENGMRPDLKKIQALRDLGRPTDIKGVRRILGLFGYYREFIPNYAETTDPLVECLRGKKKQFEWGEAQDDALRDLKNSLSETVLKIPLESDEFILETDASGYAVGAILSIKRGDEVLPVEFASHMLSQQERRWPIREKEAYAIVWALKHFEEYLRGRKFRVHTDHESLQWFLNATKGKLSRWAQCLSEYDIEVFYKKGSELVHVDTITRNPEEEQPIEDRMVYAGQYEEFKLLPSIADIQEWVEEHEQEFRNKNEYIIEDGVVWYRGAVFLPDHLRTGIMDFFHSNPVFNHPGVNKTVKKIQKVFAWPGMRVDVREYIKSCLTCQRVKPGVEAKQGLMRNFPENFPFHTIHIDLWGPIEDENRNKVQILSIIDKCTRWAEAAILYEKNSKNIVSHLMTEWFCRYGFPKTIISDQEPTFCGKELSEFYAHAGIKEIHTTVYHPEGNAPVETFHRSLKKGLTILRAQIPRLRLREALNITMFGYRSSINLSMNETPSYLTFGLDIALPPEREWQQFGDKEVQNRLEALSEIRFAIMYQAHLANQHAAQKRNEKRKPIKFSVGDLVLTRLTPHQQRKLVRLDGNAKMLPTWDTPSRVIKMEYKGYTAYCKNILTNEVNQVHIKDVRFINKPKSVEQEKQWSRELLSELTWLPDTGEKAKMLKKFWKEFPREEEIADDDLPVVPRSRTSKRSLSASSLLKVPKKPKYVID